MNAMLYIANENFSLVSINDFISLIPTIIGIILVFHCYYLIG